MITLSHEKRAEGESVNIVELARLRSVRGAFPPVVNDVPQERRERDKRHKRVTPFT